MKTPMKVDFDDTADNWLHWGELVEHWINDRLPRPENNGQLLNQMKAHGITDAEVYGPPGQAVQFYDYKDDGPLVISLPTAAMLIKARQSIHPGGPYPIPVFYDAAYSGSRKNLTESEDNVFATCRVGEYTINECC
jgi:hypothetical protein